MTASLYLRQLVEQLHEQLNNKEGQYIAPPGCEVHHYSVKRPSGVYGYNKLTAREPIFEPSIEEQKVKVIHLSHDNDPRFLEAQLGIERRNRLMRVRTLLTTAESLLRSCANTLREELSPEDNSLLIRAPEVEPVLQEVTRAPCVGMVNPYLPPVPQNDSIYPRITMELVSYLCSSLWRFFKASNTNSLREIRSFCARVLTASSNSFSPSPSNLMFNCSRLMARLG